MAQGLKALTPSTGCLWQVLALRSGRELAPSQSNLDTSYLGVSREAGCSYCFSAHHRQVAGLSSLHPPSLQRDLGWGGRRGGGQVGCCKRKIP